MKFWDKILVKWRHIVAEIFFQEFFSFLFFSSVIFQQDGESPKPFLEKGITFALAP